MNREESDLLTRRTRASAAVAVLLDALGFDPDSERLLATPDRVAASLALLTTRPAAPTPTLFDSGSYDGSIIMRRIPFHSICEHHLLPFRGEATVGYLPGERVVGLSSLARLVEYFARDLQMQERLTADIADWLERELAPRGVAVVIDAEHLCMSMRGAGTSATRTTTHLFRGELGAADLHLTEGTV